MAKKPKIAADAGVAAVRFCLQEWRAAGVCAPSDELALACRFLLQELERTAPGRTVEVRVIPYGAVQCLSGADHRRGTPPNVVEMDALTWLLVATGSLSWQELVSASKIAASGVRAVEVARLLPLRGVQSG